MHSKGSQDDPNVLGMANAISGNSAQLTRDALSLSGRRAIGHEFGHMMGLYHETDAENSNIMWQTINSSSMRVTPILYDALEGNVK